MEGSGEQPRGPGDVERRVRQRLAEIDVALPDVQGRSELGSYQIVQLFAGCLAQLTALREISAFLAAQVDALKSQSAPRD